MTFRIPALFLFLVGLLTLSAGLVAQRSDPSAQALLRAAIDKEVVDGDVQGAIEQYNAIVSKYGKTDHAVAASALLHVAECYQKLGNAQAQTVYAQIVRDYADQADAVATARGRIGAKSITERVAMTTTGFGLRLDTVTADGRFGVGADESNGDLIVRDMTTGAVTRLLKGALNPRNAQAPGRPGGELEMAVTSPDQRQVAFTRYGESGGQLWVIPNQSGGTPQLLTKGREYTLARPLAWSRDGRSLLVWLWRTNPPSQLAWISVPDGAVSVLKSFEPGLAPITWPRLSPDGRYIAYSRRARAGSPEQSIFVMASSGSNEVPLTQTVGRNESPTWTPDGKYVLFVSDRSSTFDLWAVPVRDGKGAGRPSIVRRNIGAIAPIGMTLAGSYYYRGASDDHVDRITVARRTDADSWIMDDDQHITGINANWSPDGKSIVFLTRKVGRADATGRSRVYKVMMKTLATGEERVVAEDQDFSPAAPQWFPDGKRLLVSVKINQPSNVRALAIVDVTGQSPTKLFFTHDNRTYGAAEPALTPDGKSVYFIGQSLRDGRFAKEAAFCILKMDLATEHLEEVAPLPKDSVFGDGVFIRMSPDGRSLVYLTRDQTRAHVMTLNLSDGIPKELISDALGAIEWPSWTHDGRGVFVARRDEHGQPRIVRVSLDGGALQSTTLAGVGSFGVTSDGSRLAFNTGLILHETMVLDNVLSALK